MGNLNTLYNQKWPNLTTFCQAYHRFTEDDVRFEPRRIQTPLGYGSFKQVACCLHAAWHTGMHAFAKGQHDIQTSQLGIVAQVVNHDVPIFYVDGKLASEIIATDTPDGICFEDFFWPHEGLVLGYPRSLLQDYSGEDTDYICVARLPADGVPCPKLPGTPVFCNPHTRIGTLYLTTRSTPELRASLRNSTDLLTETFDRYTFTDFTGRHTPEEQASNHEKTMSLDALVYKTLLILGTEPSLVRRGVRVEWKGNHKKNQVERWSPNFIGLGYQPKATQGGTHASPKLHRRRGHLTHQVIGDPKQLLRKSELPHTPNGKIDWARVSKEERQRFWSTHKLRWIQPILVGLGEIQET